jgi:hypothetical protein
MPITFPACVCLVVHVMINLVTTLMFAWWLHDNVWTYCNANVAVIEPCCCPVQTLVVMLVVGVGFHCLAVSKTLVAAQIFECYAAMCFCSCVGWFK